MMTPPRRHRRSPWLTRWHPLVAAGFASALVSCASPETPAEVPAPAAPAVEDTAQREQELLSWTLGAKYDATQANINFNIYSSRATRIELWIYKTAQGASPAATYVMTQNATTKVWSKSVSVATLKNSYGVTGTVYYGYRAWGPNWTYVSTWNTTTNSALGFVADVDSAGNRFNPNKLLWDPYALELSHDPVNPNNADGTVYASGPLHRYKDSGPFAPKGIVLAPDTTATGTKPTRAFKDDVVYEVHLRGLTKQDTGSGLDAACLGTYKTAGQKAAQLATLGVTAVEFLPLHETDNGNNDAVASTAGDNYWGYMNLSYFAPDRRYACDQTPGGPTREFKTMVKAFHDAGIKVLVDVVYNHTGEGGGWISGDPSTYNVMSYRGLDNPTYYSLTKDMKFNWDNTGVGGNFNTFNPTARNVILHSLSYWKDTLGVDGFRFDLASVLGNIYEHETTTHSGYEYNRDNANTALNQITTQLDPRPEAGGAGTDFIAEPWAIGGNSYQVGNFPAKWREWNGAFRDTFRKDQNQLGVESIKPSDLATRFAGSSDLYSDDGRKPAASVNFMVAHDGLTLKDIYSCNSKNNSQAWPYGPSDGGEDNNHSWDHGGNAALQRQAARNGMAFMMLSAGVPMLTGGDEFLRTQYCNNNVYNLDSNKNWLDYAWTTDQSNFRTFTQNLIAFRKAHPALRPAEFYKTNDNNGNVMEQHRWFKPDGFVPDAAYFNDATQHALAYRIDATEFSGETVSAIYVAYNGWSANVNFLLPWPGNGKQWYRVTDTCSWAEGANQVVLNPGSTNLIGGEATSYGLCGRGVLVLVAK
ncbi:isoamylase [Corallococcus exiguus]|uniref:isoamylase n=1 Tax=Corallococcus exiguus TaxID=83462 RepID=UPI001560C561|nr:isoamylase [Corallococcus exiguus]NRD55454.1 glycogen-debranching protein [Corallococcus exiguus]